MAELTQEQLGRLKKCEHIHEDCAVSDLATLAEARGREIEQLKIIEASLESGMRLRQEALDLAEARVEELREAVRLALDALTDAEHYHARACAKDEPHDHPLLRKLQATIPLVDAALAASPEPAPPKEKP